MFYYKNLNTLNMKDLLTLKTELSNEWNKPKAKNIKGKTDKREARDYKKIESLQSDMEKVKHPIVAKKESKNFRNTLAK
jgi:hypothetical protein